MARDCSTHGKKRGAYEVFRKILRKEIIMVIKM
jgi:hypothetical protein